MTDPLDDSRNPNHGRSGGLLPRQPSITQRLSFLRAKHGNVMSPELNAVMKDAFDRIEYLEATEANEIASLKAALGEVRSYAKRIRNSSKLVGPAEYTAKELEIWQRALYHEGKTIEGMVKAAMRGAEIFEPEKPAIAALPQPRAEPLRRCKHDVSEDCPACAEETIAGLKAELAEWKQAAGVEAGLRREFSARVEELEAKTSLVTFNEACKRIEALESAIQDLLTHAQIMMMEGCDCETCAPVARARALVPLSSGAARAEQERGK